MATDWLNYHHLLYFWTVARLGSLSRAAEQLHLAPPTLSSQIRKLEASLGERLFEKAGRRLKLTAAGQMAARYAEEIFGLGRELTEALQGLPTGRPLRLVVGVSDVLPKLVVYRLLRPAFSLGQEVHLTCHEASPAELLADLAAHRLDLVLSDLPADPSSGLKAHSHLLGQCGVSFFARADLAPRYRRRFPDSLTGAPVLLPPPGTALRRLLDQWFDEQEIRPRVVAEFEDSALWDVFGREGLGLFPAPAAIAADVMRQNNVRQVGTLEDLQERYYAISSPRRVPHPAVAAITHAARTELFD